jgi:hypothetical protein
VKVDQAQIAVRMTINQNIVQLVTFALSEIVNDFSSTMQASHRNNLFDKNLWTNSMDKSL